MIQISDVTIRRATGDDAAEICSHKIFSINFRLPVVPLDCRTFGTAVRYSWNIAEIDLKA